MLKSATMSPYKARSPDVIIHAYNSRYVLGWVAGVACIFSLMLGAGSSFLLQGALTKLPIEQVTGLPAISIAKPAMKTASSRPVVTTQPDVSPAVVKTRDEKIAEFLSTRYQSPLPLIQEAVRFSKQAEERTGVDHLTILAVVAKESGFVEVPSLLGWMRVRANAHPIETAQVKKLGLDTTSTEGNILLGALVLQTYKAEAMGNLDLALQRYHGSKDDATMSYAKAIRAIEDEIASAI